MHTTNATALRHTAFTAVPDPSVGIHQGMSVHAVRRAARTQADFDDIYQSAALWLLEQRARGKTGLSPYIAILNGIRAHFYGNGYVYTVSSGGKRQWQAPNVVPTDTLSAQNDTTGRTAYEAARVDPDTIRFERFEAVKHALKMLCAIVGEDDRALIELVLETGDVTQIERGQALATDFMRLRSRVRRARKRSQGATVVVVDAVLEALHD